MRNWLLVIFIILELPNSECIFEGHLIRKNVCPLANLEVVREQNPSAPIGLQSLFHNDLCQLFKSSSCRHYFHIKVMVPFRKDRAQLLQTLLDIGRCLQGGATVKHTLRYA